MQIFRVGMFDVQRLLPDQEVHLGFNTEEDCLAWIDANNRNWAEYNTPSYYFIGLLHAD